jgi:hypothetical protein
MLGQDHFDHFPGWTARQEVRQDAVLLRRGAGGISRESPSDAETMRLAALARANELVRFGQCG